MCVCVCVGGGGEGRVHNQIIIRDIDELAIVYSGEHIKHFHGKPVAVPSNVFTSKKKDGSI